MIKKIAWDTFKNTDDVDVSTLCCFSFEYLQFSSL